MTTTVYTLAINSLAQGGKRSSDSQDSSFASVQISPRDQAVMDVYHPYAAVAQDRKWLMPRLAAGKPERYKAVSFPVYLMLNDFKVIRSAVKVRLADHEHLPDRTEDQRSYTKVCRAKLRIEPASAPNDGVETITLIYSINPSPRNSRSHSASPFYIAVNFFETSDPPLPFQLSDREKVFLMMFGATNDIEAQPRHQEPTLRITRVALRAFRRHMEAIEVASKFTHNPSSPGSPGDGTK